MAAPTDAHARAEIRRAVGGDVLPTVARVGELVDALARAYPGAALPASDPPLVESEPPVLELVKVRRKKDEAEGVEWALRSIVWAQDLGVECCVVIPTRAGNGAMEELQRQGLFEPPSLTSLEEVLARGIERRRGRVFADLWDVERLAQGQPDVAAQRIERLRWMNLRQETG